MSKGLTAIEYLQTRNAQERRARDVAFALAREIVDSDPVIRVYAAPEWDELGDDGKEWVAAIVYEVLKKSAASRTENQ